VYGRATHRTGDDGAGRNPGREEGEEEGDHGVGSMLAQLESGKSVEELALELLHSVRPIAASACARLCCSPASCRVNF
jgi:hypothetical protein